MWLKELCLTTWLVILLKNALTLYMSARHNKNKMLTNTILNIIDSISMFNITDSINIELIIQNVKLADLIIFSSN